MSDAQGAGGVGADKLDQHLFVLPDLAEAVGCILAADLGQHGVPDNLVDVAVDKARPGDLHPLQQIGMGGEHLQQLRGNGPGIFPVLARHHHGQIGGQIALARVLGFVQGIRPRCGSGPESGLDSLGEAVVYQCFQACFDHLVFIPENVVC